MTALNNGFKYRDCLLKHHVRRVGWLEACRRQLERIRGREERRLKYFTFCATDAIDVLMLDVERVIRQSRGGHFDTVYFFTRTDTGLIETRKNIPGAKGFPGNFASVVLLDDLNDEADGQVPLDLEPADQPDTLETRQGIVRRDVHRQFRKAFPFDVINLDLEGYLFKPSERIPGRLINAFRRVFRWQHTAPSVGARLDSFGLMFTTKLGPERLGDDFSRMLHQTLELNLTADDVLRDALAARAGTADVRQLAKDNFDLFFKLAAPKVIATTLLEEDWHVDPNSGIQLFEFQREPDGAEPYKMLHMVMDVRRNNPTRNGRAPGEESAEARTAYREVVRRLFNTEEIVITEAVVDVPSLREDLARIEARRALYLGRVR